MCAVPKQFLIEVVEEHKEVTKVISIEKEEEDPGQFFLDEEPEISLNAITGTPNSKTMRLLGILRGQQVIILIDSGSTHNFVDEHVVKMMGLSSTNRDVIKVRIANG